MSGIVQAPSGELSIPFAQIPQNHVTSSAEKVLPESAKQSGDTPTLTLMIDNYDSFTWNLYQYLCQLGADLLVKRNDEITLSEIEELYNSKRLRNIVISPGPGHPITDSGISRDVILWAQGKVPLLGVCMGLECVVEVLGGEISYAGEIVHGKTSLVNHDSMGLFHSLPQSLPSTRYHSLAANILSLPPSLQVTATTVESGVIMGVRHRKYTIEAVQYHPESVMSEGGRELLGNFLKLNGGEWGGVNAWCGVPISGEEEVQANGVADGETERQVKPVVNGINSHTTHPMNEITPPSKSLPTAPAIPTILNKIHTQRISDIETSQSTPSTSPSNLLTSLSLHASLPVTPLVSRLTQTFPNHPAVMAEIKRASPSKGDISVTTNAPEQAIKYALAGASVISVLTEPKWFKGSLGDLLSVRMALDSLPNRPALLRKDFILSKYQIDEARLHGADTVLLIVAMLTIPQLHELYEYSVSLGMEPLVEVNNPEELNIALDLGAKVVGVNNRNLHDFKVDMETTSNLADVLKKRGREDVILCALSGISSRKDVEKYVDEGVKAVLIGEALMRAQDPKVFIKELLGLPTEIPAATNQVVVAPLVKICGVQSLEDAKVAVEAGADLVGLIFAPTRRQIALPVARKIANYIRSKRYPDDDLSSDHLQQIELSDPLNPLPWFASHTKSVSKGIKPLLVGVFRDQPLSYILSAVQVVPLDIVQLHGDEPQEWANQIPVPVIKAFRVTASNGIRGGQVDRPGCNELILLDAAGKGGSTGGGEGVSFDWSVAKKTVAKGEAGCGTSFRLPIILAGGLHPENVLEAVKEVRPWCVDVSTGVETADGKSKDPSKVKEFIRQAKLV